MALSAVTQWEVQSLGAIGNGSGFATDAANFSTNLSATGATGSTPVITHGSYAFVSGDVGAFVYIKSGTNWTPGWYKITSVSSGLATVNAAVGAVLLATGLRNTTAGCASTGSPTSGTGGIDYSQQASPAFALTGITSSGSGAVFLTALAALNMIGNFVKVVSGTNFTVGWYQVISVSAGVSVTVDRNCCSGAGSTGVLNIGGAVSKHGDITAIFDAGHTMWIKADGTYTLTATNATWLHNSNAKANIFLGYSSVRGDNGKATITTATNSVKIFFCDNTNSWGTIFQNFTISNTASSRDGGIYLQSNFHGVSVRNCILDGFTYGICSIGGMINFEMSKTEIKNCTVVGLYGDVNGGHAGSYILDNCWIHNNSVGMTTASFNGCLTLIACAIASNTNEGVSVGSASSEYGSWVFNFVNTAFRANGTGVKYNHNGSSMLPLLLMRNCIFWGNTTGFTSNITIQRPHLDTNAFGGNTTDRVGLEVGLTDFVITGDPFTSSTDFTLNATAGAGAACTQTGSPTTVGS